MTSWLSSRSLCCLKPKEPRSSPVTCRSVVVLDFRRYSYIIANVQFLVVKVFTGTAYTVLISFSCKLVDWFREKADESEEAVLWPGSSEWTGLFSFFKLGFQCATTSNFTCLDQFTHAPYTVININADCFLELTIVFEPFEYLFSTFQAAFFSYFLQLVSEW